MGCSGSGELRMRRALRCSPLAGGASSVVVSQWCSATVPILASRAAVRARGGASEGQRPPDLPAGVDHSRACRRCFRALEFSVGASGREAVDEFGLAIFWVTPLRCRATRCSASLMWAASGGLRYGAEMSASSACASTSLAQGDRPVPGARLSDLARSCFSPSSSSSRRS